MPISHINCHVAVSMNKSCKAATEDSLKSRTMAVNYFHMAINLFKCACQLFASQTGNLSIIFKLRFHINCHVAASGNKSRKTATEEGIKVKRWQLIFFNALANCLLRKQAIAHNIQASLSY